MVLFGYSKATLVALIVSLAASTDAAHIMYSQPRSSTSLGAMMLPTLSRSPFFSRDPCRVMHDFDDIFDSMLGDSEDMFYGEPLAMKRRKG